MLQPKPLQRVFVNSTKKIGTIAHWALCKSFFLNNFTQDIRACCAHTNVENSREQIDARNKQNNHQEKNKEYVLVIV